MTDKPKTECDELCESQHWCRHGKYRETPIIPKHPKVFMVRPHKRRHLGKDGKWHTITVQAHLRGIPQG